MTSASPLPSPALSVVRAAPAVDVVVPVHNEQAVLADSLRRLHDYLTEALAISWRIVIVDNASTDSTLRVAMALA
jgi:glycosyltransferase involved in cell wall biosynthesis